MNRDGLGRRAVLAVVLAVVALASGRAGAARFEYQSQIRTLDAYAGGGGLGDRPAASAPDFAPFVQTLDAYFVAPEQYTGSAWGRVSMDSRLDPALIHWSGSGDGAGTPGFVGSLGGSGKAEMTVVFAITEPVAYTLSFSMWAPVEMSITRARLQLTGPGGTVWDYDRGASASECGYLSGEDQRGVLAAGVYTLYALARGGGGSDPYYRGEGSVVFDLALIPEPASLVTLGLGTLMLGRRGRRPQR